MAQSLYQLETGVVALVNTLTLFGFANEAIAEAALDGNRFAKILQLSDKFLQAKDCINAVIAFNLGEIIAKCLSPKEIKDNFGLQGYFLVPLVIFGPFVEFFRSEFDSFVGILKDNDKNAIIVSRFALSPYIGEWVHHDYGLTINANGTGTDVEYLGFDPQCAGDNEANRYGALKFTPESGYAIGVYTSVMYDSCVSSSEHDINVGDSFKLTPESYDRLLLTWIGTPPNDYYSTLWLCGPSTPLDVNIDGVCGA